MRKKSWAQPFLDQHPEYVIANPSDYKGKWETLLPQKMLHVEIGCGKGDYFIQMAQKYPEHSFIAIEKDRNVSAVAAKKALQENLPNTKMIVSDAAAICDWFAPKEVQILHLNFSDPWPKSGHSKRRLSHSAFLKQYETILADDGEIQMKTDNKSLFEYSLVEFSQNNWLLAEVSVDFRRMEQDDAMTEYERKFVGLQQPIYRLVVKKRR